MPQDKKLDYDPIFQLRKAVYGMTPNGFTASEREEMNLPKYRKGNLPKGDPRLIKPIAEKINADRHYQYQQGDGEYPDDTNDTRDKRIDKYGKQTMSNMQSKEYGTTALGGSSGSYANQGPISKMMGVRNDKLGRK